MQLKCLSLLVLLGVITCSGLGNCGKGQVVCRENCSRDPEYPRPEKVTPEILAAISFLNARSFRSIPAGPEEIFRDSLTFRARTIERADDVGKPITDADLIHLKQFPHLRSLTIERGRITAKGMQIIGQLKTLQSLELLEMPGIRSQDIAYLKDLRLRKLELTGCGNIDNGIFRIILNTGGIFNLQSDDPRYHAAALTLSGTRVTQAAVNDFEKKGQTALHIEFDPTWYPITRPPPVD